MKVLILMMSLMITSVSFATEVETQCPAMNQNREKIIKNVKSKSSGSTKALSTKQ